MRVNDYVRTGRGYIGKCVEPFNKNKPYDLIIDYRADTTNIKKASLNLIDLVTIDDFINDYKVIDLCSPEGTYVLWVKLADGSIIHDSKEIKEFITAELIEQIKYKVNEVQ